jgi:hypothetical protein
VKDTNAYPLFVSFGPMGTSTFAKLGYELKACCTTAVLASGPRFPTNRRNFAGLLDSGIADWGALDDLIVTLFLCCDNRKDSGRIPEANRRSDDLEFVFVTRFLDDMWQLV